MEKHKTGKRWKVKSEKIKNVLKNSEDYFM